MSGSIKQKQAPIFAKPFKQTRFLERKTKNKMGTWDQTSGQNEIEISTFAGVRRAVWAHALDSLKEASARYADTGPARYPNTRTRISMSYCERWMMIIRWTKGDLGPSPMDSEKWWDRWAEAWYLFQLSWAEIAIIESLFASRGGFFFPIILINFGNLFHISACFLKF